MFETWRDPLYIQWNVDGNGDRISIEHLAEEYVVANNKILLREIPDEFYGVIISGKTEMRGNEQNKVVPDNNHFKVDYTFGIITLHENSEGSTITVDSYYGRGIIYFPASRIWTQIEGDVVQTLESLIEEGQDALDALVDLNDLYVDYYDVLRPDVIEKTTNANNAAFYANEQGDYANTEGDYANTEGDYANAQGDYANAQGGYALEKGNYADGRGDYAQNRGDYADGRGDYANTQGDYALAQGDNALIQANYAQSIADELVHKGSYNSGITYQKRNVVLYQGSSYMAIQETLGNVPTNTNFWELVALKGVDGEGAGDMVKTVYDSNDSGIVDDSEQLGGELPSYYIQKMLKNNVQIFSNTSQVNIGIPEYNNATDEMIVAQNTAMLAEGIDYTIDVDKIVKTSGTWDSDTYFYFVVITNSK